MSAAITPADTDLAAQEKVDRAVRDMLDSLGYYAPVAGDAGAESDDRARRDSIAAMVAEALPARIRRAVRY